ncbi:5-methylcytosine-specific restriction enzyme subunit McrC [Methylobacterium fujisawaense]|uniref:5-methylcytosine-specific restriction enzyme subunit McrC n=1 Tax=Methylobacterium fujisawaense TaxID=107400 RepID=A0ABR6D5Z1_9HYPH|nr:5-methylcytosine-specific restriction endonuclease system specificity protein McrC [Methylobacterium fujisawaense]MBA9061516.1 5-methylcytosine-specific restriction enzyme subunit McrC [Methylobacterium fujisawaense]
MLAAPALEPGALGSRHIGRIPVRNIWLLFLYAHNLARFQGQYGAAAEASPDFPSLIARILCYAVDRRLRRNLSRGYIQKEAALTRVRGRIDLLETYAGDLLSKGMIACRFEEFTFDTPRNRLVRAALDALSSWVDDRVLAHDCLRLAGDLGRHGVGGLKPSRAELSVDRVGRHDANDMLMVTLAHFVFDLVLPTEEAGGHTLAGVEKDIILVRHLFEKAVGMFYAAELSPLGWKVQLGKGLKWQIERATPGIAAIMPGMISDIILEHGFSAQRIVIDTKFTSVFGRSQHRAAILKSGYIYQMYAYLRTQERPDDPLSSHAAGMFLHPGIDAEVDETVRIQGHDIRFATVDLMLPTTSIIARLRALIPPPPVGPFMGAPTG